MGGRADAAAARSHRHVPLFESASDGPGVHREAPTDGGPGFASVVGRFGFVELGLGQDWLSWPLRRSPLRRSSTVVRCMSSPQARLRIVAPLR